MISFFVHEPTLYISDALCFGDEQLSGSAAQRMLQTNTSLTRLKFLGEQTPLTLIIVNSDYIV